MAWDSRVSPMSVERVDKDAMDAELSNQLYKPEVDTSQVDERTLLRKMDIRIVPWLGLLYLLNFLDRGAIGNAKVRVYAGQFGEGTHGRQVVRSNNRLEYYGQPVSHRANSLLLSLCYI